MPASLGTVRWQEFWEDVGEEGGERLEADWEDGGLQSGARVSP